MQTFLPYKSFSRSAKVLDRARLGKQRVEVLQILSTLSRVLQSTNSAYDPMAKVGWSNHPAVRMWKGHESVLAVYGLTICDEWISRCYRDTCRDKIEKYCQAFGDVPLIEPWWLGNPQFHLAHQSNLLRKNEEYYRPFFPYVPNDLPYFWPDPKARVEGAAIQWNTYGLTEIDGSWFR